MIKPVILTVIFLLLAYIVIGVFEENKIFNGEDNERNSRFTVKKYRIFSGERRNFSLKERGVAIYVITDMSTKKEYISIYGVGIVELVKNK